MNDSAGTGAIVLDTNVVSEPLRPAPDEDILAAFAGGVVADVHHYGDAG